VRLADRARAAVVLLAIVYVTLVLVLSDRPTTLRDWRMMIWVKLFTPIMVFVVLERALRTRRD
jgi:hypothetical protein